jgi:uncharacterized protein YbgA (DUF1722 family)
MPDEQQIYIIELANGAKFKSTDCSIGFDTDRLDEHRLLALDKIDRSILGPIISINGVKVTKFQFNDYISQYAHQLLESEEHAEDVSKVLKHLGYTRKDIQSVDKIGYKQRPNSARNKRKRKLAKNRRQRKNL